MHRVEHKGLGNRRMSLTHVVLRHQASPLLSTFINHWERFADQQASARVCARCVRTKLAHPVVEGDDGLDVRISLQTWQKVDRGGEPRPVWVGDIHEPGERHHVDVRVDWHK